MENTIGRTIDVLEKLGGTLSETVIEAGEYIFPILVRRQYLLGFLYMIIFTISVIIIYAIYKGIIVPGLNKLKENNTKTNHYYEYNDNLNECDAIVYFSGVISILLLILGLTSLYNGIQCLIIPEYGAIQNLIDIIRFKGGP